MFSINNQSNMSQCYPAICFLTVVCCLFTISSTAGELVGEWHFNENSETSAGDDSKYNNNVILKNGAKTVDGALFLDGEDDKAEIPHKSIYNFGENDNFTVCFRMKKNPGGSRVARIVSKLKGTSPFTFHLNSDRNNIIFFRYDGSEIFSLSSEDVNVQDDKWHHIAAVKEGKQLKLYVDGSPAAEGLDGIKGEINNKGNIIIGKQANMFFSGKVDDLYIFSRALSDNEIAKLKNGEKLLPFPKGEVVIAADKLLNARFYGRDKKKVIKSVENVQAMPFAKALQFEINTMPSAKNAVSLKLKTEKPIKKDTPLLLFFYCRGQSRHESGKGELLVSAPKAKKSAITIFPVKQWQKFVFPLQMKSNATLQINLTLGQRIQRLQIGGFEVIRPDNMKYQDLLKFNSP